MSDVYDIAMLIQLFSITASTTTYIKCLRNITVPTVILSTTLPYPNYSISSISTPKTKQVALPVLNEKLPPVHLISHSPYLFGFPKLLIEG